MIKIIFLVFLFISDVFSIEIDNIISSIEKMNTLNKIPQTIPYKVYDPFSNAKPILNTKSKSINSITPSVEPISLQTVLNNRAFIDGKWYNCGEKVRDYKVKFIGSDSVVLVKDSKEITLRLKMVNSILTMKEQKK